MIITTIVTITTFVIKSKKIIKCNKKTVGRQVSKDTI